MKMSSSLITHDHKYRLVRAKRRVRILDYSLIGLSRCGPPGFGDCFSSHQISGGPCSPLLARQPEPMPIDCFKQSIISIAGADTHET